MHVLFGKCNMIFDSNLYQKLNQIEKKVEIQQYCIGNEIDNINGNAYSNISNTNNNSNNTVNVESNIISNLVIEHL